MIFDNVTILTMDPQRRIILNGAVVVSGRKIVAVGKSKEIVEKFPEKRRINGNGNILLPGLYNTHVHMAQCMLRGISEGKPLDSLSNWLSQRTWPLQGSYTEEDGRASASLCILEMLKAGTTGFVECLLAGVYGFDGIAEVCIDSGIRAALGRIAMDISPETKEKLGMHPGMYETREQCLTGAIQAYDRWNNAGDGRLQVWFGCRSVSDGHDPSLFDEVGRLARERNMGITIHLSEQESDIQLAHKLGFRSLTEFAHTHGILGPRTVLAHYCASTEHEWELAARTGTSISHNPANNSTAGWTPAPVVEMMAAGVNVALGCDGAPSNSNMDVLRDMRIACHSARVSHHTRNVMPSETVLEMATINGARALGIEDQTGSIEVGKCADFIIINTDSPNLTPVWNPVSSVVFAAQGSDVDTVVIDGRIIMQGRKMLTMDEGAILEDVRKRYQEVAKRANVSGIAPRWPIT
ncbi:MAG: amidohydrolase [Anaerolineaceae bacterium]|nr:amidohydrolase [Anaerolineaceae bacterium]